MYCKLLWVLNAKHILTKVTWVCRIVSLIRTPDSLLITVAAMAVYTGYVFMPQHIMAILHYFEVVQWRHLPSSSGCSPPPPGGRKTNCSRTVHHDVMMAVITSNKDTCVCWRRPPLRSVQLCVCGRVASYTSTVCNCKSTHCPVYKCTLLYIYMETFFLFFLNNALVLFHGSGLFRW